MFDMTGEQVRKMKGNYNYFLEKKYLNQTYDLILLSPDHIFL